MIDDVFSTAWEHPQPMVSQMLDCPSNLLAVCMVSSLPAPAPADTASDRMLERTRSVVRQNLSDAALDVATVVAKVGLSPRQVHFVFSPSGTALIRWTWEQRLRRMASELENPTLAARPVSLIAFEWGNCFLVLGCDEACPEVGD